MPGVTSEQIKTAKEVDLLSYLQTAEPHELKKINNSEYRTVTHSSLVISKGLWCWNKTGIGGRTAVDYLIKVRGMGFVDAVQSVLDCSAAPALFALPVEKSGRAPPTKKLFLPKPVSLPTNAVKYLERRGIHQDIIIQCLKLGIFYEAIYKNPKEPRYDGSAICVFVGKDDNGIARFAALRGISSDLKRDAYGSDKEFNFTLPANNTDSRALAVFEAPLDLLSHASFVRRGDLNFEGHRLSLGGTSDVALLAYLERNPSIERVFLCLDNDEAGSLAISRITEKLTGDEQFKHILITADQPIGAKDYNDALLQVIKLEKEEFNSTKNKNRVGYDAVSSL